MKKEKINQNKTSYKPTVKQSQREAIENVVKTGSCHAELNGF